MKNKLAMIVALTMMFSLCGCGNRGCADMNYTYDYAIISLPNGEIVEGNIEKWWDYENGDQIQVKIDGNIYLVHSEDVVLIKKGAEQ